MRSLPFILPFMVACASDTTTKVFNSTPEITITSHDASIEIDERQSVDFIAQVSDANHLASELEVTWVKDGETICDWSAPSENGESLCSISFEDTDATVTVQARDPEGAAAMESVQVTIIPNEAPSASIISPIETGSYYSDEMIAFRAEVSDVENVPPDLDISWESSLDGTLPLLSTADANGSVESAGYLSEGSHLIQLSVTDLSGKTTTDSVVVLVSGENSRPECSITDPTDGSAATLSEMVVFRGLATDTDIPSEELQIMWASDRDGEMGSGTVNSAGEVSLPFDTLTAGTHTISLQVSDEVGALCTDTIILSIGTPPVLNIATPIDGDLAEFGSSISFSATVSDNEDIPSQISVSWNSDLDGLISNQSPDSSGNINFTSASLRAGIHNILVTATDPAGLNTTETLSLRVNNSPTAPTVTISPTPAQTGDNLIAVASGSNDADGDNITYQFEWLQNGITTNNTSATILSADTTKGELWTVRVTPNDGFQNGNSTEQSITIANTPPVIAAVSISPTNPTSSEILTCSGSASDLDGETLSESYSWENQNTGMILGSGSSITLLPSAVAPGDVVTCTYQASDSDDSSSDTTSVTVENSAPEISNVHINPSAPYIGETLTCSVSASDPDVETLVETYTWTNSTSGSALGTGVTYTLIEGDALPNDTIVCSVEVQDAAGESATDTATASVQNQAPTIDAITLDQSVLRLGDTITCMATASDLDGETPTISYEWSNLTTQSTLGVGASITLTNSMASSLDEIECVAVAEDGYGESDSASITISVEQNAPAFVVDAQITPGTGVKSNTMLTCAGAALDPDGSLSSLAYLWENQTTGSNLGTGDTLALDSSIAQPNDTISCTITATDSNQNTTDSSDSVTVENTTPVITSLSLSPDPVYTNDTLVASVTDSDVDGESTTLTYEWQRNGNTIFSGPDNTFSGGNFSKDDQITVLVTSADANSTSAVESVSITCSNTPPEAPVISITPSTPTAGMSDLVCSVDTASVDDDGDSVTYTFGWTVDGISYTGATDSATTSTVDVSVPQQGEEWICTVIPNDGDDDGTPSSFAVQLDTDCDPYAEVSYNGVCYYLDGSSGSCDSGYTLAPQSVLYTIGSDFIGKTYKNQVSSNCCIVHRDQSSEGQDFGMNQQCNTAGPFTEGPVPGGAGCTDQQNTSSNQLTFCMSN